MKRFLAEVLGTDVHVKHDRNIHQFALLLLYIFRFSLIIIDKSPGYTIEVGMRFMWVELGTYFSLWQYPLEVP